MKKLLLFLFFFLVYSNTQAQWTQIGDNIFGESPDDKSGQSVATSSDGSIVAIGAHGNDFSRGHIRIYRNESGTWQQLGQDIDGEHSKDSSGIDIALSSDGLTVAIGAIYNSDSERLAGQVRVYRYENDVWVQLGEDIDGSFSYEESGRTVSLNDEGSILAIGSKKSHSDDFKGRVRIYELQVNTWVQKGQDIIGDDGIINSIQLNSTGEIVVIGAPYYGINAYQTGQVKVYKYLNNSWSQKGQDIYGEPYSSIGTSVSTNANGSIIAIGGRFSDINGVDSGQASAFYYKDGIWFQMGETIKGDLAYDNFGRSVRLNASGSILAVGADLNVVERNEPGYAKVFLFSSNGWSQLGETIYGEARDDAFGRSVYVNSFGNIVSVGAPDSPLFSHDEGYVKIYRNEMIDSEGMSSFVIVTKPISCTGLSDSEIKVIASDGSMPYTYTLLDGSGMNVIYPPQSSDLIENLGVGNYIVRVSDSNGGISENPITVNQPNQIVFDSLATDATCFANTDGSIEITNICGGILPYTYELLDGQNTVITTSTSDSNNFLVENITAGDYIIRISDDTDKIVTSPTISIGSPTELNGNTFVSRETCPGEYEGRIQIFASGGIAPYQYQINNETPTNFNTFINLTVGSYVLTVIDAVGCVFSSSVEITGINCSSNSLQANATVINPISYSGANDAVIQVEASGGIEPYLYELLDENLNVIVSSQPNNLFENLGQGNYIVKVIDYAPEESLTNTITIVEPEVLQVTYTITNIDSNGLFVYPNPVEQSDVNIILEDSSIIDVRLFLYTSGGSLIFGETAKVSNGVVKINMDGFSSGMYSLKIETSNETYMRKIIKK